jgi:adenylate cyclase
MVAMGPGFPAEWTMASKRRVDKIEPSKPDEPAHGAAAVAPGPSRLDRVLAKLKTLKGAIVAIAGVGAVLGGLAGYWNAYQAARGNTESSKLLALVGEGDAGALSIVVLPFANLSGDPLQAYVADGITGAVTADLSRIRDAFIVSTATAFAYKHKPLTVQQIGKELGVRFALQGGVQRSGDKINAQLADTTSNAQLWSESFDGSQGNLFALQESVTARIGNSIGREMVIVAARDSEARKSTPAVADLMLRARALNLKPVRELSSSSGRPAHAGLQGTTSAQALTAVSV